MSTVSTDPIADMLSRIRNAIAVRKASVTMPHSKVKESVANLLKQNNFVDGVDVSGEGIERTLTVVINAGATNARITEIKRISKPGRREYAKSEKIPVVKRGRGIIIVSTSRGIMTGAEAKKLGVGGELICSVY